MPPDTIPAEEVSARELFIAARWPDGIRCPACGGVEIGSVATRGLFRCRACRKQFSERVGTIFEDSPLPLSAWFVAVRCVADGDSTTSVVLAEKLNTSQRTAWTMLDRIRRAMRTPTFRRLSE